MSFSPSVTHDPLPEPHSLAQRRHVAAAAAMFERVAGCLPRASPIAPMEGWLRPGVERVLYDPMGTRRAEHDHVPDDGATTRSQVAAIAARFRAAIARDLPAAAPLVPGGPARQVCDEDRVGDMHIVVENIVHTSFFVAAGAPAFGASAPAMQAAQQLIPPTLMWRRLGFMGLQPNKVHTSAKICYQPPYNGIHIVFPSGRVFETGGKHTVMTRLLLEEVTLPYLRAAGLAHLRVGPRAMQNIVAKSALPEGRTLNVSALYAEHGNRPADAGESVPVVEYAPISFPGAIITFDKPPGAIAPGITPAAKGSGKKKKKKKGAQEKSVTMLVFAVGVAICVGNSSFAQLRQAYTKTYALLMQYASRKRKRAAADARQGQEPPQKKRKRLIMGAYV